MLLIGLFSLLRWMEITLPAVNSSLKLENTEAGLKKHWLTWAVLFFSLEALLKICFLGIKGDCKGEILHAFKYIDIVFQFLTQILPFQNSILCISFQLSC